jgi:diguanylate cyclase (GGDEF)-like protein/PAS domain S-box-containing protein
LSTSRANWGAYAIAAAIAGTFFVVVGLDVGGSDFALAFDDLATVAVPAAAAVACARTARGIQGDRRATQSWLLLGAACASWALGQAVWAWYELGRGVEVPFPSFADVGFLGLVPLAAVAVLALFPRSSAGRGRSRPLLDALIIVLSIAFVSWIGFLGELYASTTGTFAERAIALAYPFGDVLVVSMVLLTVFWPGREARVVVALIALGLVSLAVSDAGFAYLTATGRYATGNIIDGGWVVGFLLIALAAHQSRRSVHRTDIGRLTPSRASHLPAYLAVITAVIAASVEEGMHGTLHPFLVWDGILLVATIVTRQLLALFDHARLTEHLEDEVSARTAALREREASSRLLFDANPLPMFLCHVTTGAVLDVNNAAVDHYGWDRSKWLTFTSGDLRAPGETGAGDVLLDLSGARRHLTRAGRVIDVELVSHPVAFDGEPAVLVTVTDVTERNSLERELRHQAFHDSLTGLPNRALMLDRLEHGLARLQRHRGVVGVLLLDLDDFKTVNDSLGHAIGDQLLAVVAERLRTITRQDDTVARLGGDEFVVITDGMTDADVDATAARIASEIGAPIIVEGRELRVRVSIGIAMARKGAAAGELLRDADVALYQAKARGRGQWVRFDDDLRGAAMARLTLDGELRRAVDDGQFVVHYQPVISLADGSVKGAEALVRWQHPDRGLVAPAAFLPVAEENGLIAEIGRMVLAEATTQARRWLDDEVGRLTVSVNVAARQLAGNRLVGETAAAIDRAGIDPSQLVLEVTEHALLEDIEGATSVLHELSELGVQLSVDDFGTGYSSLVYLRQLPVDQLKVDRAFVSGLPTSERDAAIVAGVISLAHSLGLTVVAEGVEDHGLADRLAELGCELGQGYLWSPALAPEEFATWLARRRPTVPTRR